MRRKNLRQRGFSMIEVLFAIFLAAMSAAILAASMPIATMSRTKADYQNKATSLAQKQLEAIRSLGYANVTASQLSVYSLIDNLTPVATNTYTWTNVDSGVLDSPANVLPGGTARILVDQPDIDMRRVIVTVYWVDRGRTKSIVLGTLVANL